MAQPAEDPKVAALRAERSQLYPVGDAGEKKLVWGGTRPQPRKPGRSIAFSAPGHRLFDLHRVAPTGDTN